MSTTIGQTTIGVLASDQIAVGLVDNHQLSGPIHIYPEAGQNSKEEVAAGLQSLPSDEIAATIFRQIESVCRERAIDIRSLGAIGIGFPGIIRDGIIEESPNLKQVKGLNLKSAIAAALGDAPVRVLILNDADAMAAGIATTRGQLEKLVRAWTLGNGIGFGRSPQAEGPWEGGHMVVTLEPKEQFCGCGGEGHLEGIMGHRAMRLRFLDMEPEEVFANARTGDVRCATFARLWHRALAAATATSIHLDGCGKFYISGPNAKFVDVGLLSQYLHDMVKMTPLQGSVFEVVPTSNETAIVGAAVNAGRVATA
ncbi:MAG: ROK family protein [Bryobacteraceae bacterium]